MNREAEGLDRAKLEKDFDKTVLELQNAEKNKQVDEAKKLKKEFNQLQQEEVLVDEAEELTQKLIRKQHEDRFKQ